MSEEEVYWPPPKIEPGGVMLTHEKYASLRADLIRKDAALALAGEVLTDNEWAGRCDITKYETCPSCHNYKVFDHTPYCRLAAARRAVKEALKS